MTADQTAVPEVVCVGMAVVDVLAEGITTLPAGGETVHVPGVTVIPGGDAVNQSVTLAALGHRAGLMTVVGDDWQGKLIAGYCQARGVDVAGVTVTADYPTTTSIVLIDQSGERSFISPRSGTARSYGPEHARLDYLRPGLKILSAASLFTSGPMDLELLPPLLARARELGAVTVADLVNDRQDGSLAQVAEVLAQLDYIIPSRTEAAFFTGSSDPATAAEAFRGYGAKNVIIKLGGAGAYALTPDGPLHVPAFDVRAVDTTGAGDSFVAGFLSGLLLGQPVAAALRRGSATAALSVQAVGATAGVRNPRQVADALSTLPVRTPEST